MCVIARNTLVALRPLVALWGEVSLLFERLNSYSCIVQCVRWHSFLTDFVLVQGVL